MSEWVSNRESENEMKWYSNEQAYVVHNCVFHFVTIQKSCCFFFVLCARLWCEYDTSRKYLSKWKMPDENFIFDLASLVWFLFGLLYLFLKLLSLRELVLNAICALEKFKEKRISNSPKDVKCGKLKFTYLKERKLIVQANTSDARFYRWIKYNLIYANHYYHCDNVL